MPSAYRAVTPNTHTRTLMCVWCHSTFHFTRRLAAHLLQGRLLHWGRSRKTFYYTKFTFLFFCFLFFLWLICYFFLLAHTHTFVYCAILWAGHNLLLLISTAQSAQAAKHPDVVGVVVVIGSDFGTAHRDGGSSRAHQWCRRACDPLILKVFYALAALLLTLGNLHESSRELAWQRQGEGRGSSSRNRESNCWILAMWAELDWNGMAGAIDE